MKRKKNLGNKGFSLVELIIVISIMAILIGVVGTQVVPYLEKSRQSKDSQVINAVATAAVSAFATSAGVVDSSKEYILTLSSGTTLSACTFTAGGSAISTTEEKIREEFSYFTGIDLTKKPIDEILKPKMESNEGKKLNKLVITVAADTGVVTVEAFDNTPASILEKIESK